MTIDLDSIAAMLIEQRGSSTCIHGFPDGTVVSTALPWMSPEVSRRWVGNRMFFFHSAIPDRKRIAIVSSRLRRRLDLESWWIDLVRTAILRCDSESDSIVVASATAPFSVVSRAAELFGRPLLRFDVSRSESFRTHTEVRNWLAKCLEEFTGGRIEGGIKNHLVISVSPEFKCDDEASPDVELSSIPLGDRLLFAAASRIEVLSCRAKGNLERLLIAHLQEPERLQVPVWIASNPEGEFPATIADLPSGWVPWIVQPLAEPAVCPEQTPSRFRASIQPAAGQAAGWSSPLLQPDDWLLHWTRAPGGPWPGESEADYMDSLILRLESTERTAFATLLKIVKDGKLIASSQGIRGGYAVVAFTEVPLTEFRSRRVFRKHRNRFDFEPWGIGIRKQQLRQIGIRPVIYGTDADWRQMDPADRPYFQKATVDGATSNVTEREQRIEGHVGLRQFPSDSVCIFVENTAAAEHFALHCEWPVIVVPGGR